MIKKLLKKLWMSELCCILFHSKIKTKKKIHAVDPITLRPYGKHKCEICGRKFLANNKFDWFRVKNKKKLKID
jgi:hypothetical protein